MQASARELLEGDLNIPSLPIVYARIDEALRDSRSSIDEIAAIVSRDPGVASRLLCLVNSSVYGFPSRITTISRAVMIVGTHELRELVLATSVMRLFEGIPEDLADMSQFWRHSIGCGLTAKFLATRRSAPNSERFFVAGVLHDVGRLIVYMNLAEEAREILELRKIEESLLYEIERDQLGFDHADVGRELMRYWKLPVFLEEAIGCHHAPESAVRFPLETAILHLADLITNALQLGSSGEMFVPPLNEHAWDRVGLSPTLLPDVMEHVRQQYGEVVKSIL